MYLALISMDDDSIARVPANPPNLNFISVLGSFSFSWSASSPRSSPSPSGDHSQKDETNINFFIVVKSADPTIADRVRGSGGAAWVNLIGLSWAAPIRTSPVDPLRSCKRPAWSTPKTICLVSTCCFTILPQRFTELWYWSARTSSRTRDTFLF